MTILGACCACGPFALGAVAADVCCVEVVEMVSAALCFGL